MRKVILATVLGLAMGVFVHALWAQGTVKGYQIDDGVFEVKQKFGGSYVTNAWLYVETIQAQSPPIKKEYWYLNDFGMHAWKKPGAAHQTVEVQFLYRAAPGTYTKNTALGDQDNGDAFRRAMNSSAGFTTHEFIDCYCVTE